MDNSKKVLITGGDGFIGRNLCLKYERLGYDVRKLSRSVNGDLLYFDYECFFRDFKPDIIIHCAGSPGVQYSIAHPKADFESNVATLHRILFELLANKLHPKFVYLSSAAVYGQPVVLPINEDSDLMPISPYAMHKRLGEDICNYFINQYGFDIEILRIFSAYGPGLKKQIMWDICMKIRQTGEVTLFGTGEEGRDFIYIDDLVKAIMLIAEKNGNINHIWNVASGRQTYIKDIATLFVENSDLDRDKIKFIGEKRSGDPNNWMADISRLKSIGFAPEVSIETGIKNYCSWVKNL